VLLTERIRLLLRSTAPDAEVRPAEQQTP